MQVFDNIHKTVKEDLQVEIVKNSRFSIAAACFSIYAFQELKTQLEAIDQLRFLFTSKTFVTEKAPKEKREFYIPRLSRERSLYGTEFEVKLRNELSQKAIAKECADWIRAKVTFKSIVTSENMNHFMNVEADSKASTYLPLNGFTTVDIGCERGNNICNMITKIDAPTSYEFLHLFDALWNDPTKLQDVTDEVLDNITVAYRENSPDLIYFITLYNIFSEFLEDISEDVLPNEATGFKTSKIWNMLYDFQKDVALSIINKLEKYNGCILADSVGLGKTFTALAVIKYYADRNKSVLVLCPKKLSDNWNTYKDNYINNPIVEDKLNYDVLYHTDLSRKRGRSNGLDLARINWGNYDMVVIDESHNFRNGTGTHANTVENRYIRLMEQVIRAGVKTKVLMLSATPVNNRFFDLRNQLALAYEGDSSLIDDKLNTSKSIDEIFKSAQRVFTTWSKLDPEARTTATLLRMLDFDFFEVLDSVTIARSRKHIQKYYNLNDIGAFPKRKKPLSLRPSLSDLNNAINYSEIYDLLLQLNLHVYTPTDFIFPSRLYKYDDGSTRLTQRGREQGMQRLMSINLLKRLESSVYAFNLTAQRIAGFIRDTIAVIDSYNNGGCQLDLIDLANPQDFDDDDQNTDFFTVGRKVKIDLADMDYKSWRDDLASDLDHLELLIAMVTDITPAHDTKLQSLFQILSEKIANPINPGNKKVLIFTAFADTADYLYKHVSDYIKKNFGLDTALISGSVDGKTTIPKFQANMNNVLTCFLPISKDKHVLMPESPHEIDVLVATDCISEGQNLQDCDFVINYDIHWNPVRIIQRFGRIDRIGNRNAEIQLVNFWPDLPLDEYINLKNRVETRMKISVMTSTGDDDLINAEEKGELEYRRAQLEKLQEEVVDIEDMASGISIMDLGLNEFSLDLLEFIKQNPEIERAPYGMEAVVSAIADNPPGVIYVLRNINGSINKNDQNRLHPFYMVYIADDGSVVCDHLSPKDLLDKMRLLCRGNNLPDQALCDLLNRETKGGKNMNKHSALLRKAIGSMINLKEESDIASLFKQGGTTALLSDFKGLDDFELICFLIIK